MSSSLEEGDLEKTQEDEAAGRHEDEEREESRLVATLNIFEALRWISISSLGSVWGKEGQKKEG